MGRLAGRAEPVCRRARLPARARRQRRPTGEPPPPPRPVAITATAWLVLAAGLAVAFVVAQRWLQADERAGTWVLRQLAAIRTPWLTDAANGISVAGSGWGPRLLGLSVIALIIAFRRWRHLAVFVGGLLFLDFAGAWFYPGLARPRPYGVPIIGSWSGPASAPPLVTFFVFCLLGVVYCLAVPGRARSRAKAAV